MSCSLIYGVERSIERGYDRKGLGKALSIEIDDLIEGRAFRIDDGVSNRLLRKDWLAIPPGGTGILTHDVHRDYDA